MTCKECGEEIRPCPCGVWWCSGWTHSHNRDVGGSHFCYLGQPKKIAEPAAPEPKFTSAEICSGIASAVKAHDFPAVISLLKLLAVQDPHQAEVVYESMLAVLDGRCTP